MKVVHESLLDEFRYKTRCECCGKRCPQGGDPSHIYGRGAGRVDIRENIVALSRECHSSSHAGGKPTKADLLAIAAKREKTTVEAIEEKVMRLRRSDLCKVWDVDNPPFEGEP